MILTNTYPNINRYIVDRPNGINYFLEVDHDNSNVSGHWRYRVFLCLRNPTSPGRAVYKIAGVGQTIGDALSDLDDNLHGNLI